MEMRVEMEKILATLACVLEETVRRFTAKNPVARFAFDCNADYGDVFVALDTSPKSVPIETFLSEKAEKLYCFGDWPNPDISQDDSFVKELWKARWEQHKDVILSTWPDLPDFEHARRKKLLLQGICAIAARLSASLPEITAPILVADHDEHIRHSTARMAWAYKGPPSPAHALLADGFWLSNEKEFSNYLAFFHDGEFINHLTSCGDSISVIKGDGDWRLCNKRLLLTITDTNFKEAREILWKELSYEILSLDKKVLCYRGQEGECYEYAQGTNNTKL